MKTPYWSLLAVTLSTSLAAQTVPRPLTNAPISDPALAPMATTTAPAAPALTNAPAAKPAKPKKAATPRKQHAPKPAVTKPAATNAPAAASPAVKLVPGPAVVTGETVNVRGQPSLRAEVITRLKRGDAVTVLEAVAPEKPKHSGPAQWARIAFPTNAPVWVFAEFVDPTNKTVTVAKLNLRAGPGENYSVVGTLRRGDTVNETLAKNHWLALEPPTNAVAFIAAEFLKQDLKPELKVETPAPTAAAPPTNVVVTPVAAVPAVAPPPTATTNQAAATTNAPAPPAVSAETSNAVPAVVTVTTTNPPAPAATVTNEPAPPPAPVAEEPPPKRIVEREGIVRTSWSIQAPSWFELANPDTGETMDYLYSRSPRLDLRRYKGLRVLVTGEEGMDRRWKTTPVLTIQKIRLAE